MRDALVTIKVAPALRQRMRRLKINWSAELRQAIEQRLAAAERREAEAALREIHARVRPGFDTTAAIRADREQH